MPSRKLGAESECWNLFLLANLAFDSRRGVVKSFQGRDEKDMASNVRGLVEWRAWPCSVLDMALFSGGRGLVEWRVWPC